MGFCNFHKEECDDEKIIKIIELKQGKIKEIEICEDCIAKYLETETKNVLEEIPESIEELVNLFLESKKNKSDNSEKCKVCGTLKEHHLCPNCIKKIENKELSPKEKKIKILKEKMAAAISEENYEAAAVLKKELERITKND